MGESGFAVSRAQGWQPHAGMVGAAVWCDSHWLLVLLPPSGDAFTRLGLS
jgi:hypothetical protein